MGTMGTANPQEFVYTPALLAKERQLMTTLRALEAMLETVQELRTKVNFERTQLYNIIEMMKARNRGEQPVPYLPIPLEKPGSSADDSNRDPLVLLDKLYNGAFCESEEEEDDEDDDVAGDDFGLDNVQW